MKNELEKKCSKEGISEDEVIYVLSFYFIADESLYFCC